MLKCSFAQLGKLRWPPVPAHNRCPTICTHQVQEVCRARRQRRPRGGSLARTQPVSVAARDHRPGSASPEPARRTQRTRSPGAGSDGRRIAESFPPRPPPGLHADPVLEEEPRERRVRRFPRGRSGERVGMETSGADRDSRYRARAAFSQTSCPRYSITAYAPTPSFPSARLQAALERSAWARAFPRH